MCYKKNFTACFVPPGTNQIMEKMKVSGLTRKQNYAGRWQALIKNATSVLDKLMVLAAKSPRNYIIDQVS